MRVVGGGRKVQIGADRRDHQGRSQASILTGLAVCVLAISLLLVSTCMILYWQDLMRFSRFVRFIVNPPPPVELPQVKSGSTHFNSLLRPIRPTPL
jgi:hypothetical protein